ncbi:MAG: 30S ribosomal protein S18 [Elusimicrobiota bacterium]
MENANQPIKETAPVRNKGVNFSRKPVQKKKQCRFCIEKIKTIDWRQSQLLKMFTTDTGRIIPRKITGVCAKHQRQLDKAIKINRNLGLMPYTTMMRK